jgi:hypothetical protein
MLFNEIMPFCPKSHMKPTNTLTGQNAEDFYDVKAGGM